MRKLSRAFIAPVLAAVLALACVSFALATGSYDPPPSTHHVYPCVPDHTSHHGGDDGNWQAWWTWLKSKYGSKWADDLKARYGSGLDKYIQSKYVNTGAAATYFNGTTMHNGGGDDEDCEPECPDGKASSSTTSTRTYGGGDEEHEDDCKCPDDDKASSYTM